MNTPSQPAQPDTSGRLADLIFGTVTGMLCGGIKPLYAMGLVFLTRGTGSGPASFTMARFAVWGFLIVPALVYFSLMASYGASALWTGGPGGRWFGRPEIDTLVTPLPPEQITLAKSAGRGALGGLVGLASVSIVLAAFLVICLIMMFFGPGPMILVLWLGVALGAATVCTIWGALIGSLIYCRRKFGWLVGIGAACVIAVICNMLIGLIVK